MCVYAYVRTYVCMYCSECVSVYEYMCVCVCMCIHTCTYMTVTHMYISQKYNMYSQRN